MTAAIVSVETVLLVLLLVLVVGLLRSHAEILRRLESAPRDPLPAPRRRAARDGSAPGAPPLAGTTLNGDSLQLAFEHDGGPATLLAFLSSGCGTCESFWDALGKRRAAPGVQTVIVTRGADRERPAALRRLAPPNVPVVMSSQAWEAYEVPGAPYFVLVDGGIVGEGVASTWDALRSLLADAVEDAGADGPARARLVDDTLAAAGIGPGDPSLYPSRARGER